MHLRAARKTSRSPHRANILAAARELLAAGVDRLSMRTLAETAAVSIATPYNLFGSKQAILLALLDDDLAAFEQQLSSPATRGADALFEAAEVMAAELAGAPDYYRNILAAVARDGDPDLRFMISGPRYLVWKRLLREAIEAGALHGGLDPDALAIAVSQQVSINVQQWAQNLLELDEMRARIEFGLAMNLLAIATDASRAQLERRLHDAQTRLQIMWRAAIGGMLRKGVLDDEARAVLADQLVYVER